MWGYIMPDNSGTGYQFDEDLKQETEKKLDEPKMYRVILHNDHYTTMDFVVEVLTKIFHMPAAKAVQVMLDVHKKGAGMCGVYSFDIAVTKVNQVHDMARAREYPLKCSYEEA
jgi:ATP-dependent Clp protease adaptor protein ClpS